MRKILLLLLLLPLSVKANLLQNGGFETQGTVFSPYWWFGGNGTFVSDSDAYSGSYSQRIDVTEPTSLYTGGAGVPLQTGQLYDASVWLKSNTWQRVRLSLQHADTGVAYGAKVVIVAPVWTQYRFTSGADNANARFVVKAETPGTLWVDDASLTVNEGMASASYFEQLTSKVIPPSYFGMHLHQNVSYLWPSLSIGARRIWDGPHGTSWDTINTAQGVYTWTALDALVADAQSRNVELVMNLGRTPEWASARPTEYSPYGPGRSSEPASLESWNQWVTAVATRYQGVIKHWEIWNEPGFPWTPGMFYTGTPEKLLEMQQSAYSILKAIDPQNKVLTPAFADLDYAEYFMRIGGGYSADILAHHMYVNEVDPAPEKIYKYYAPTVRNLATNYTVGKTLGVWNTEQGVLPTNGCNQLNDNDSSNYVARAYLINWASGIDRFFWYAYDNQCMGVRLTTDNVTLTAAGNAYNEIAQWTVGKKLKALTVDAKNNWTVTLEDSSGVKSYVVWNPNSYHYFAIPASWSVTQQKRIGGAVYDCYTGYCEILSFQTPTLVSP